ncbi:MAG: hypothetical protein LBC59_01680 [Chitinispirillales bacterium]|jgi:hypothetical protein|nr:hypothetical protein [Chitinispirillales bacterium]
MADNVVYTLGKRLLISNSRRTVRGSVIFFLTHLLFFAGIAFAAEIMLVLLGVWGIHVPFVGQVTRMLGG